MKNIELTDSQKSARVWLWYLDGWQAAHVGETSKLGYSAYPKCNDKTRKRCVKLYNKHGRFDAKRISYRMGYAGEMI